MTAKSLYDWMAENVVTGRNPETGKKNPFPTKNEVLNSDVIIRVGGKERSLNQVKVESGKVILIG